MKQRRQADLARSIRRTLILRLALVALGMSVVLGGLASWYEKRRTEQRLVEVVLERAIFFDVASRAGAEASGPLDRDALARAFHSFLEVESSGSMGELVLARLFDHRQQLVASFQGEGLESAGALAAALEQPRERFGDEVRAWHRYVAVEGAPHVIVGGAMHDATGEVVAHAEGAFRVSDAALADVRANVLVTTLAVVLVTFLTAASVYPIVMSLTGGLLVLSGNLLRANIDTAQVLGSAIAKRDSDTSDHNFRVTIMSVRIAEAHGLEHQAIRNLMKGAFVHDVGKIAISDNILLKPGRLTEDEYEVMKTHVKEGVDIVERSSWLNEAVDIVQYHHEKYDGTGYLHGLKGEEIPVEARVFAIADVFDALTSRRPYKEPMGLEQALSILEQGRGTHFDPALLDAFAPIAPRLHRELIADPQEPAETILNRLGEDYFSRAVEKVGA